jgi:hypothetical protein
MRHSLTRCRLGSRRSLLLRLQLQQLLQQRVNAVDFGLQNAKRLRVSKDVG